MLVNPLSLAAAVSPVHNLSLPMSSPGRPGVGSFHGKVNVLLGGAMLSGVILVVCLVCYCCHRNVRKGGRGVHYYEEEPDVPLEVFTIDGLCYEVAGLFVTGEMCTAPRPPLPTPRPPPPRSPPPAYEAVVLRENKEDGDEDLPSYEAALRLEAQGYV